MCRKLANLGLSPWPAQPGQVRQNKARQAIVLYSYSVDAMPVWEVAQCEWNNEDAHFAQETPIAAGHAEKVLSRDSQYGSCAISLKAFPCSSMRTLSENGMAPCIWIEGKDPWRRWLRELAGVVAKVSANSLYYFGVLIWYIIFVVFLIFPLNVILTIIYFFYESIKSILCWL